MKLNKFTWNNGTQSSPIVLTNDQIKKFIAIGQRTDIVSDVRGYVTTNSRKMQKFLKYALTQQFPNLNGAIDLTCFPVLEVLEARNDNRVEEFILPSTDNLKTLNLPSGLTKITINNKPNIEDISLQSMDNVMEITIIGSNNYGAATFGIDTIYDFINS